MLLFKLRNVLCKRASHHLYHYKRLSSNRIARLTDTEFYRISGETLDVMAEYLESLFLTDQGIKNFPKAECEYAEGVLTLKLGHDHGTYVLNRQPPVHQIWLSSPFSGPRHYEYCAVQNEWIDKKKNVLNSHQKSAPQTLHKLIESELGSRIGLNLKIPRP